LDDAKVDGECPHVTVTLCHTTTTWHRDLAAGSGHHHHHHESGFLIFDLIFDF
jgi:hypothetical protein